MKMYKLITFRGHFPNIFIILLNKSENKLTQHRYFNINNHFIFCSGTM